MTVLSSLCVLATTHAFAGGEVSAGGGAFICPDKSQSQFLDLFEAQIPGVVTTAGLSVPPSNAPVEQQVQAAFDRLGLGSPLRTLLMSVYADVKSAREQDMPAGDGIAWPADAHNEYQKNGCAPQGIILFHDDYGNAQLSDQDWISVDRAALLSLPNQQQAATWVHETVYKFFRAAQSDKDSIRSRAIVGLLFSNESQSDMIRDINQQLLNWDLNALPSHAWGEALVGTFDLFESQIPGVRSQSGLVIPPSDAPIEDQVQAAFARLYPGTDLYKQVLKAYAEVASKEVVFPGVPNQLQAATRVHDTMEQFSNEHVVSKVYNLKTFDPNNQYTWDRYPEWAARPVVEYLFSNISQKELDAALLRSADLNPAGNGQLTCSPLMGSDLYCTIQRQYRDQPVKAPTFSFVLDKKDSDSGCQVPQSYRQIDGNGGTVTNTSVSAIQDALNQGATTGVFTSPGYGSWLAVYGSQIEFSPDPSFYSQVYHGLFSSGALDCYAQIVMTDVSGKQFSRDTNPFRPIVHIDSYPNPN